MSLRIVIKGFRKRQSNSFRRFERSDRKPFVRLQKRPGLTYIKTLFSGPARLAGIPGLTWRILVRF